MNPVLLSLLSKAFHQCLTLHELLPLNNLPCFFNGMLLLLYHLVLMSIGDWGTMELFLIEDRELESIVQFLPVHLLLLYRLNRYLVTLFCCRVMEWLSGCTCIWLSCPG